MLIPRGSAILSECAKFRVWLERDLGGLRPLVSIGANPSTADHEKDDQTMRKEQGFARFWGCGRLVKVNMNGYRATKPKDMWAAAARGEDIIGVDVKGLHNDDYILRAIQLAIDHGGIVLGAWGAITKPDRVADVLLKIRDRFPDWYHDVGIQCLGKNGDGSPKHTLYLPYETPRERWEPGLWAA